MNTLAEIGGLTLKTLATLDKQFQKRVRQWLDEMIQTGIQPLIYCGFRSFEEQSALYAKGRTAGGRIVTKARAGESYHNYGLAFDWVPVKASAKDPQLYFADWENETAYKVGEQCGHTFGLAAISWETGHLQASEFKTWREIPGAGDSVGTMVAKAAAVGTQASASRKVKIRRA